MMPPHFHADSPDLFTLIAPDARMEQLATGAIWSEGPVWIAADQSLLWSDIPNNRMLRWSAPDGLSVWREKVEFTNGHTLDLNGDLLHCSHGLRAVVRTPSVNGIPAAQNGTDSIVISKNLGKRLNSPNDIVVRSDGTMWFTDPPYGILSNHEGYQAEQEQEQSACFVFCFDTKTQTLTAATDTMIHPNGLAFSLDEKTLYVSDTSAVVLKDKGFHRIMAFDVNGTTLSNPHEFAEISPGLPDGFRLDIHGNLFISSEESVQIYAPNGTRIGKIFVPEKVGNLTFGGRDGSELFIVASTSLYRIATLTRGALYQ
jgi:gluconolactonase